MDQKGPEMSKDERKLVTCACKYIIEQDQKTWRTLKVFEEITRFEDKLDVIREFKDMVSTRHFKNCQKVIDTV